MTEAQRPPLPLFTFESAVEIEFQSVFTTTSMVRAIYANRISITLDAQCFTDRRVK